MNGSFVQQTRRNRLSELAVAIEDDLEDASQQASMILDALTAIAQDTAPDEGNSVYREMIEQFPGIASTNLTVDAYIEASLFFTARIADLGRNLTRLSIDVEDMLLGR